MLTYLRYALATAFFAASIGCLALWWRSCSYRDAMVVKNALTAYKSVGVESFLGSMRVVPLGPSIFPHDAWGHSSQQMDDRTRQLLSAAIEGHGQFQGSSSQVRFPLWYPALIFALAGVGVLRSRRQFSIRSALVVVSVVAAVLGMAVVL